jgi:hypothetical protein
MDELLGYLEKVILTILDNQPPPGLGQWDWPGIARDLRRLIAKARAER